MEKQLQKELSLGSKKLGLSISPNTQQQLLDFLQLLQKWNKAYNLTAITDPREMLISHLLDSLSIAAHLKANRIIDIGTGAGFPGIPLALTFSEKQFVLLDSVGKKTAFLLQAVATLKLTNVSVVQARAEQYQPDNCFEALVCRAFGSIAEIIEKSQHLLCENGQWLLMKGEYPTDELANVQLPYKVERLTVPGLNANRHLVVINNRKEKQ
jgi:16S rRNA (guanine527-N7)-methyltransferase